MLKAFLNSFN